jgi:DNA repair protein RecO (recombination protein O)
VTALVLRRQDRGEADRRLTLLSPELGKFDATAKGARKPTSRLAAVSEPLAQASFSIASGRANRFITQAQLRAPLRALRQEYPRLLAALAYVELLAAVLPWEEPSEVAFAMALSGLTAIALHEDALVAAVWGQLRLLELTGFLPNFETCVVTGLRVQEAYGYVSPSMGGYAIEPEARSAADRYLVRAEALVGLARAAALEVPPPRLKFADEALFALMPVWAHVTEAPLPAVAAYSAFVRGEAG